MPVERHRIILLAALVVAACGRVLFAQESAPEAVDDAQTEGREKVADLEPNKFVEESGNLIRMLLGTRTVEVPVENFEQLRDLAVATNAESTELYALSLKTGDFAVTPVEPGGSVEFSTSNVAVLQVGDVGYTISEVEFVVSPRGSVVWKRAPLMRLTATDQLRISWSKTNDELQGFSTKTGEWTPLRIAKQSNIFPEASGTVAAVRLGNSIAAFSSETGNWDAFQLAPDSTPVLNMYNGLAVVENGEYQYTFAASNGRWTSPTDPEFQTVQMTCQPSRVSAEVVGQRLMAWVASLEGTEIHGDISWHDNSITIVSRRKSWMPLAQAKLEEFDVPVESGLPGQEQVPAQPTSETLNAQATASPGNLEILIGNLKRQTSELEVSTATDAEQLRQTLPTDKASTDAMTASVQKLFDLRQQLQSAEAERMRLKLQTIEANLAVRLRNRDRIVQRRVEELLDPNGTSTGWNSPVQATPRGDYGMATTAKGSLLEKAVEPWWLDLTNLLESLRDLKTNSEAAKRDLAGRIEYLAKARTSRPSDVEKEQRLVDEGQELLTVLLSNWKHVWSVYQSQLQALKLDVNEAQLHADTLQETLDRLKDLKDTPASDLAEAASQQAKAIIEVKRSEELLRLFADLEKREPQFNPATFGETK